MTDCRIRALKTRREAEVSTRTHCQTIIEQMEDKIERYRYIIELHQIQLEAADAEIMRIDNLLSAA